RLLAINLSDLAAMGAEPAYAFLALSTPPGFDHRRFFRALIRACRQAGAVLAGGDLAASREATVATLTLIGRRPESGRFLHRADAAPGHALWLGGTIGESAAGQRLIARGAPAPEAAATAHVGILARPAGGGRRDGRLGRPGDRSPPSLPGERRRCGDLRGRAAVA